MTVQLDSFTTATAGVHNKWFLKCEETVTNWEKMGFGISRFLVLHNTRSTRVNLKPDNSLKQLHDLLVEMNIKSFWCGKVRGNLRVI